MTTQHQCNAFSQVFADMQEIGIPIPPKRIEIKIPNARKILGNYLFAYLQQLGVETPKWLPEYEDIAKWLENNEGRGLLLYGHCGRGKTVLARYVLPAILNRFCRKVVAVYDIQEMNQQLDNLLKKRIISLDDIGTEEVIVNFGERRLAFAEIMDRAEKNGMLVIITTNLSADGFSHQYGPRVLERIISTTKRVSFEGKSFRK